MTNCVIFIGMPGAGKSTLGVQFAKETARDFVDIDVLIQVRENKTLQQIMDESDYMKLREVEAQVLQTLRLDRCVIATGGSAVYSSAGMMALKRLGSVVFLDVDLAELRNRIHNYEGRGIARRVDQSFEDLFQERRTLYLQYADIIIDCNNKTQEQVLEELQQRL
ncbi:MAG: shikimate kinase [Oceanicoccus sp.]